MASPAFTKPEDIGNRALQHCGASRIVTLQDNDKGAAEISQCYDGLRRAELRRNLWTFSVKKAVLYPINTPVTGAPIGSTTTSTGGLAGTQATLLYAAAQWSATKTYPFGWIVAHNGGTWVCVDDGSLNAEPGASGVTDWTTFFGSMCVNPWFNPSTVGQPGTNIANQFSGYFVGDLVYVGEQVFVSLENTNTQNPLTPSVWSNIAVYNQGTVVQDAQGFMWQSVFSNNLNLQPGVYGMWSSTPTYVAGALVIGSNGMLYSSIAAGNTNHDPTATVGFWTLLGAPGSWPIWEAAVTYAKGEFVMGNDNHVYQSVQGSNANNQPVGSVYNPNTPATNWWVDTGIIAPWIANFQGGACNSAWLGLDGELEPLNINYPIGTGPSIQTQNKNIFLLPNGYLRRAPQDPKAGSVSFLGAPTGRMYDDWEYNGKFIISQSPWPIIFRFGADIVQVNEMDDMYCEALGARIASEVCETLTQSTQKLGAISTAYKKFVDEARTVNGIEQGATEPDEDDYITCRI